MGDKSGIQWTDASWNPVTGCTKISPGCAHCYAETITLRFKRGGPFLPGKTTIQLHPDRLNIPLKWKRPRKIFVCSMSDLFHEEVPDEFLPRVFAAMAAAPQHTYQVLTKRPERMCEVLSDHVFADAVGQAFKWEFGGDQDFVTWPLPNIIAMVSVENQYWASRRIPLLAETPAAIRGLSVEPLLKAIDLTQYLDPLDWGRETGGPQGWMPYPRPFDWVICGGESGPHARPMDLDWMRDLRDQCAAGGVKFFGKQLGSAWAKENGADRMGGDWSYWPEDLRIREFPAIPKVAA
jgi:protein gp37